MGLFSPQVATKQLVPLCREMATAHEAGVPILHTLEILARAERDRKLRNILTQMHDDIRGGTTLGEAVRAHSRYLPSFLIEVLESGEVGGNLDVALNDLAQYFEDRLVMTRRITQALVGPAIRLVAAWFLGTFALRLLPQIRELIRGRGDKQFDMFGYVEQYWRFQASAMLLFATVFVVCVVLSRVGLFGWVVGLFTTHVWPVSKVTRKFALARFFRTMSLLLTSGLRVDHCVEKAAAATANPYIERDLLRAVPGIQAGRSLVEAFSASRYLTPLAREMLEVGEQSGKLPEALHKVAEYHMNEASHAAQAATKVVTIFIILGVAALIGYIVITFFGTLYANMLGEFMD